MPIRDKESLEFKLLEKMLDGTSIDTVFAGIGRSERTSRDWEDTYGAGFPWFHLMDPSLASDDLAVAKIVSGNLELHHTSEDTAIASALCYYDQDITYTYWGISGANFEPVDGASKKCAKICGSDGDECSSVRSRPWNTVDCSTTLPYICEVPCKSL